MKRKNPLNPFHPLTHFPLSPFHFQLSHFQTSMPIKKFQQLIFLGNLGKDPEMRHTQNGNAMTTFSVAMDVAQDDKPVWVDVAVFGKQAEACNEYLHKGSKVLVQGKISKVTTFARKNGEPGIGFSVTADTVQFLGDNAGRSNGNAPAEDEEPVEEDHIPF
jgi:single-strand DNA-binding protein